MPGKSSENRKKLRSACWSRGQARKQDRIRAQHAREQANRVLRAQGLPTPWEQACAKRRLARAGGGDG